VRGRDNQGRFSEGVGAISGGSREGHDDWYHMSQKPAVGTEIALKKFNVVGGRD